MYAIGIEPSSQTGETETTQRRTPHRLGADAMRLMIYAYPSRQAAEDAIRLMRLTSLRAVVVPLSADHAPPPTFTRVRTSRRLSRSAI